MSDSQRGFSIVDLVIVLSVMALLAALSGPAIEQFLIRSKIDTFSTTASSLMRQARLESIKRSQPAVLRVNTATGRGVAFVDADQDQVVDEDEVMIGFLNMPGGLLYEAPGTEPVVEGFETSGDEAWVVFNSNGSVERAGALRFRDLRGNMMELRVAPAATAKIRVRKWNESLPVMEDGSHWYGDGEGGEPWTWE